MSEPVAEPQRARRAAAERAGARVGAWAAGVDAAPLAAVEGKHEQQRKRQRDKAGAGAAAADAAVATPPPDSAAAAPAGAPPPDLLFGCAKCRFLAGGCGACRAGTPAYARPRARWRPAAGRAQVGVPAAPTFHPTAEEFEDPAAYIAAITPAAAPYGLAVVVPPPGWDPPLAFERAAGGPGIDALRFPAKAQLTSHLCCREPPAAPAGGKAAAGGGRYGAAAAAPPAEAPSEAPTVEADGGAPALTAADVLAALEAVSAGGSPAAAAASAAAAPPPPPEFGFETRAGAHGLRSFAAYADWALALHFSSPPATGTGAPAAPARRPAGLPRLARPPVDPSLEEVEAEFWRIVEDPAAEEVESLYGQDLDTSQYGSGFPLPRGLAAARAARAAGAADVPDSADDSGPEGAGGGEGEGGAAAARARAAARHPWNLQRLARRPGSLLRHAGAGPLSGVTVPWLYVGSPLAAFCWHVEDMGLYSVNYLHGGAPKVWYAAPAAAAGALEAAFADALPDLVAAAPGLLRQLVTMLSPAELRRRGVPVARAVHRAGTFIVTMPGAYHAGFNAGFNVAEAVNFAAAPWLPTGTDAAAAAAAARRPLAFSHDALLVALARAALPEEEEAAEVEAGGRAAARPPAEGVRLAAGELALRAGEEAARWAAGLAALAAAGAPAPRRRRVGAGASAAATAAAAGLPADTADLDCAECSCDLWLAAAASPAAPGAVFCLEHAAALVAARGAPPASVELLVRHEPAELAALAAAAAAAVPGGEAAVAAARGRRTAAAATAPRPVRRGALYAQGAVEEVAAAGKRHARPRGGGKRARGGR